MKEIAPSDELRKWFSHDPKKWEEFKTRYKKELKDKIEFINKIKDIEKNNTTVTLIYSAKDEEHNNAVVLEDIINKI